MLANYRFAELVTVRTLDFDCPWNWKILVENFMEAYHHVGTHRQTLELVYPGRQSCAEDNHGAPWSLLRMPGRHQGDSTGLPPFPELTPAQRDELIAACVFPTFMIASSAGTAVWYEAHPAAHDRMRLRIHVLLRPEVAETLDAEARAAVAEGVRFIHIEDITANEGAWRGLHAPLTTQGRLSRYEKAIWQLNQQWAARIEQPRTIPRM